MPTGRSVSASCVSVVALACCMSLRPALAGSIADAGRGVSALSPGANPYPRCTESELASRTCKYRCWLLREHRPAAPAHPLSLTWSCAALSAVPCNLPNQGACELHNLPAAGLLADMHRYTLKSPAALEPVVSPSWACSRILGD